MIENGTLTRIRQIRVRFDEKLKLCLSEGMSKSLAENIAAESVGKEAVEYIDMLLDERDELMRRLEDDLK